MIVVTTPTGQIGSKLVPHLLAAGEAVRVIVRDPSKLAPDIRERVEIVTGSLDDEAVLQSALNNVESMFLVVPPSSVDNNDEAYYLRFTLPALRAMQKQGVRRLVAVSVLGHGTTLSKNAGPVTASLAKDAAIEKSGVDYRALWCPALMENMLNNVPSIKTQGMFASPTSPDMKTPQVATADIAAAGSTLLLDRTWMGQGGRAVLGPEDLSMNDMAAIISEVLAKPVSYKQIPADGYKAQLLQHGANEVFAEGILAMLNAKNNGLDNVELRSPHNTTPTHFQQWCEEVLKPLIVQ